MGPFVEGPGIVRRPVVTQDFQNKRCETRPRASASVGEDRGLRGDPLRPQERVEFVGGLQRPVARIKEFGPLQVDGPRKMAEPGWRSIIHPTVVISPGTSESAGIWVRYLRRVRGNGAMYTIM